MNKKKGDHSLHTHFGDPPFYCVRSTSYFINSICVFSLLLFLHHKMWIFFFDIKPVQNAIIRTQKKIQSRSSPFMFKFVQPHVRTSCCRQHCPTNHLYSIHNHLYKIWFTCIAINGVNEILDDAHVLLFIFAFCKNGSELSSICLFTHESTGKKMEKESHSSYSSTIWTISLNIEYLNCVSRGFLVDEAAKWYDMKKIESEKEKKKWRFCGEKQSKRFYLKNRSWPEIRNENWLCIRIFDWNGRAIMALRKFFIKLNFFTQPIRITGKVRCETGFFSLSPSLQPFGWCWVKDEKKMHKEEIAPVDT